MTPRKRPGPRHGWLTQHLIDQFPALPAEVVVAAVLDAWAVVELFSLGEQEATAMAGRIAAQQLAQHSELER